MVVTVLTPAYFPPLAAFAQAACADQLIWAESFRFTKQTCMHRMAIKTRAGRQWLTVPVLQRTNPPQNVAETLIDGHQPWQKSHLRALHLNYHNAPYFYAYWDELEELLNREWLRLGDLLLAGWQFCQSHLGINKPTHSAADLQRVDNRTERIVAWSRALQADRYLYRPEEAGLFDLHRLANLGIEPREIKITPETYPQLFGPFIECTVLDALFNLGPESRRLMIAEAVAPLIDGQTNRKE